MEVEANGGDPGAASSGRSGEPVTAAVVEPPAPARRGSEL